MRQWRRERLQRAPAAPVTNPPPATASRACYGNDQPACNLRTYQVMVESFVDGDGSANYGVGYGPSQHNGDLRGSSTAWTHQEPQRQRHLADPGVRLLRGARR